MGGPGSSAIGGRALANRVTWSDSIPVPQPEDEGYEVPFCQIPGMTPGTIPDAVQLWTRDVRLADDRDYEHHNVLDKDEMKDPATAVSLRVSELGETHDLIIVGDGLSLDDSRCLAVFKASSAIE